MDADPRRTQAKQRAIILIVIAIFGGIAVWYFIQPAGLRELNSISDSAAQFAAKQLTQTVSAPPPLKKTIPVPAGSDSTLTVEGVIAFTNQQRRTNGSLPALKENATLDEIATVRLRDMFAQQYFAHVGPQGENAESVASSVGYTYIALGENLAEGNFAGDQGVVVAWMGSPGHRANILNTHYTEIGVAVASGTFEGERTWIAVQIFGRPSADCPAPDPSLKTKIDSEEAKLSQMSADLDQKKAAIDAMEPKSGSAYTQAVNDYNAEAAQYNALVGQVKTEVTQYNSAVQTYNTCIGA